jgi:hypothetical protein
VHTFWCREILPKNSRFRGKKVENKGSDFFLPARSMLLTVVTGKISETLESASWKCFS